MKKIRQINCECKLFCHLNNFTETKKIFLKFSRAIHTQAKTLKCHLPTWNIYFLNYQSGKPSTLAAARAVLGGSAAGHHWLMWVGWSKRQHTIIGNDAVLCAGTWMSRDSETWKRIGLKTPCFPSSFPHWCYQLGSLRGEGLLHASSLLCLPAAAIASCAQFKVQQLLIACAEWHHRVFSFLYPLCVVGDIPLVCRPLTGPQLASVIPSSGGH